LFSVLALSTLLVPSALVAQKNFLVLAKSSGKGSTQFAASIAAKGGIITANLESLGVLGVTSSDPNFAANTAALPGVQAVAEDPVVQWLPNEKVVQFTGSAATGQGVNSEPFFGFQWNIPTIHADVTAAAGDLGAGARVAIVDNGMDLTNPDLVPNIN